jgi:acetyl esterase/lipase
VAAPSTSGPPLPPPAHDAPIPPPRLTSTGVRVLPGLRFAAIPGIRPLELDLWLPPAHAGDRQEPADGPDPGHPLVVFLHGGGWRMGSRHVMGPAYTRYDPNPFEQVALAGLAVASVDYRLSGEAQWPTQLHDAKAAVRWLRKRATELAIDPTKIAAWGESAGGHLAALLGLTPDHPDLEGQVGVTGPSSAVRTVVAWYPPTDLPGFAADSGSDPNDESTREALLLGATPAAASASAAEASPVTYTPAAEQPFLILHGRSDRLIPSVQSERLAAKLSAAGAAVDFDLYDGADHMWFGAPEVAADALTRSIDFLLGHLGAKSAEAGA